MNVIQTIKNIQFDEKYEQPIINDIINYYNKNNSLLLPHRIQLYHILRRHKSELKIKFNNLNLISDNERNKINNKLYLSDNNKLIVQFKYNPDLVNLVKEIPTRRFNSKHKYWTIIINPITIPIIKEKLFDIFNVDIDVINYINKSMINYNNSINQSKAKQSDFNVIGLTSDFQLRPFQLAGIKYAIDKKRVLIGDEQGLGKTVQSIASIIQVNAFPVLIICLKTLVYNWEKEWNMWSDKNLTISILSTNNIKTRSKNKIKYKSDENNYNADVYIINYDIVEKMLDNIQSLEIKAIIIDESHKIKNYKAKRTKAIKKFVNRNKIKYRYLLSGTPILKTPADLISQLNILGRLDDLGGFWYYWDNYVLSEDPNKLLKLNELLRKTCYIRRNKKDVLKELPNKNHIIIDTELDSYKEYNNAEIEILQQIISNVIDKPVNENDVNELHKWLQLLVDNGEITEDKANAFKIMLISKYQSITIQQKMNSIKNWIDEFFVNNNNKKLVVFGIHTNVLITLKDYYSEKFNYDIPIIIGDIDIKSRQNYINEFQTNDNVKLIFLNITAGGVGLTLTEANDLLLIEKPWTPGEEEQATDRIHRIGQKNDSINIYHLLARDTIDYYIHKTINYKRLITSAVNQGEIVKYKAKKYKLDNNNFFEKILNKL